MNSRTSCQKCGFQLEPSSSRCPVCGAHSSSSTGPLRPHHSGGLMRGGGVVTLLALALVVALAVFHIPIGVIVIAGFLASFVGVAVKSGAGTREVNPRYLPGVDYHGGHMGDFSGHGGGDIGGGGFGGGDG